MDLSIPLMQHDPHRSWITDPDPDNPKGTHPKRLMTEAKGNSKFCFPETLNVPRGETEGNITVEGKQYPLFPAGPVINMSFVILPNSKIDKKKKTRKNRLLDSGWLTNLSQFQGARPNHVRVESSSCCFSRKLVSFVRPRSK